VSVETKSHSFSDRVFRLQYWIAWKSTAGFWRWMEKRTAGQQFPLFIHTVHRMRRSYTIAILQKEI